jgi:ribosome maturation factor RimP
LRSRRPGSSGRSARPPISGLPSGQKVSIRTDPELNGRKKFRGTVAAASTKELALDVADGARITIPYDAIVRGNLVDEGER